MNGLRPKDKERSKKVKGERVAKVDLGNSRERVTVGSAAVPSDREGIANVTAGQSQRRECISPAADSRSKPRVHSSRNVHEKYHAPSLIHLRKTDLYFVRDVYANMLAPPVSMASISASVQGRRPKREGSSARSKNSPAWGLTGPSEAPEWLPTAPLKEERPRGPCCWALAR